MSVEAKALRRLTRELSKIHDLEELGIYVSWDDEAPMVVWALIIGPTGTPYEGGFYLFQLCFTSDYPFTPPQVKTLTQGNGTRLHPNLYISGKVCLSILGTWGRSTWSCADTVRSVLLSLQSILDSDPLRNEPGYDGNHRANVCRVYQKVIECENLRTAILGVVDRVRRSHTDGFRRFHDVIETRFDKGRESILKRIAAVEDVTYTVSIYGLTTSFSRSALQQTFDILTAYDDATDKAAGAGDDRRLNVLTSAVGDLNIVRS